MVRYNWEEEVLIELGETHPKKFKKETREWIKENTLDYIKKYGRHDWVSLGNIFRDIIYPTTIFNSPTGNFWFSSQGVKTKINSIVFLLRIKGYPIISGKGKRGFRYADWNNDEVIDLWDEKRSAWESRHEKWEREGKIDIELIEKILKKLLEKGQKEKAKKLQEVLIRYKQRIEES